MKIFYILLTSFFLFSCSVKEKPTVEVLGSMRGTLVNGENGKRKLIESDTLNVNKGEAAVWYAYVRTNKEKIRYVEIVKLNGSTKWNVDNDGKSKDDNVIDFVISEDKSTATITKEVSSNNGFLAGIWDMYKDEPLGEMSIKIIIEGSSVEVFNWKLVSN